MLEDHVSDSEDIASFFERFQQGLHKENVMSPLVRQTLRERGSISFNGYEAVLVHFRDISSEITSQLSFCLGPIDIPAVSDERATHYYHPLTGHYLGTSPHYILLLKL